MRTAMMSLLAAMSLLFVLSDCSSMPSKADPSSHRLAERSTLSSPTQSATPGSCAATGNGDTFQGYKINCSTDFHGGDLSNTPSSSFAGCAPKCDALSGCVGFSYVGGQSSGVCYFKSSQIGGSPDSGVDSGFRATPVSSSKVTPTTTASLRSSTLVTSTIKSSSSATSPSAKSSSSSTRATSSSSTVRSSTSLPPSSKSTSISISTTKPAVTTSNSSTSSRSSSASSKPFSPTSSSSSTSSSTSVSSTSSTIVSSFTTSSPAQSPTPIKNSGKRGLAYTNDTLTTSFSLHSQNSLVSWSYNWFYARQPSAPAYLTNKALTFIPTLFNDEPNLLATWPAEARAAIDDGADVIFSFNEPDVCWDGSACMSVEQSMTAYKSAIMPFAGKARLGAPAVTDQGGSGGLQYLEDFIGNCTGCQIDFINLHWYNNMYASSYFKTYITAAHARFPNHPIYISEFGDNSNSGDAQTQVFLKQVLPWLDAVPWIERYSWFGTFPGFLINANGSGLSEQGAIYNSYTAGCANPGSTSGMC